MVGRIVGRRTIGLVCNSAKRSGALFESLLSCRKARTGKASPGFSRRSRAGHLGVSVFLLRHRNDNADIRYEHSHHANASSSDLACGGVIFFNTILIAMAVNAVVSRTDPGLAE